MKLYLLRGCPFAHRATFVLREKGLAFEPMLFELGARPPALEALGPHAKSPTLFDGDVSVWDSQIVIEYLEDRYPESALLPRDAAGRAQSRMLASRVGSEFGAKQGAFAAEAIFKPEPQRDAEKINAAKQGVIAAMAPWDELLAGRQFFVGEALSHADITLYTLVDAFLRYAGVAIPQELGSLGAWYQRLSARPSSRIFAT